MRYLEASAHIVGEYRYWLRRSWYPIFEDDGVRVALWIMLNPSTADGKQDDPTIRRVVGFSNRWGFAACTIVNLFALRTPYPVQLKSHADPIGPLNDETIYREAQNADRIVCAWGGQSLAEERGRDVLMTLAEYHVLWCLGTTSYGHPRHPLYVPSDRPLQRYEAS